VTIYGRAGDGGGGDNLSHRGGLTRTYLSQTAGWNLMENLLFLSHSLPKTWLFLDHINI